MNNPFNGSVHDHGRACGGSVLPRAIRELRCEFGHELGRALARFRRMAVFTAALALVLPLAAFAQSNAAPARITARIDESHLTTLRGNTHPLARAQYDQGAVADSLPIHRMLLLLRRSPEQETALRTLIDQQQSKSSPSFHQWLTPQQIGQQYGPATADIQTVTSWLTSHGFQIARVSASGTLIEFSGTAGQVLNAFHAQIHRYVVDGQERLANSTDPQIPAALAPVVAGPVSLHNFPRKAQSRNLGVFRKNLATGKVAPQFSFACTNFAGANATCNALGPGDFAKIYNVQSLWNSSIDGTGQTIAVTGDSEICTANSPDFATACAGNDDVANFRTIFGLPANSPNVILDGPDPGFNPDEIEGNLDVQWSGAVAKGATIDYVIAEATEASAGIDLAAENIVDNNLAPILSESYGACEASLGATGNQFYSNLWEQAAAQGITVIISTGDNGSAGCDDQNTETAAGQNPLLAFGPGVNGLASTPFNVAAGGTDFDITATSYQTTYWSPVGVETTNAQGITHISALSYIPETSWNDSCAQNFNGALNGCSPPPNAASLNIFSGGGGQSNCIDYAIDPIYGTYSCQTVSATSGAMGYPKPSWQTVATGSGLNATTDLTRDLPDISLFAADGQVSNSFYAICDANFSSGPCDATPGFVDVIGVGGTSSSAPTFAGIMALVNQQMAATNTTNNNNALPVRQGNANYVLYNLHASQVANTTLQCSTSPTQTPASGCTFNDVTRGNNSVPCVGGSPNCSNLANPAAYGVLEAMNPFTFLLTGLAFNAGPGFDLATGLGSINVANLVNNWGAAVGKFTATTTTLCLWLAPATACPSTVPTTLGPITHGQTVNVQITVTPNPFTSNAIPEDASLIGCFTTVASCNASSTGAAPADRFNFNAGNADIYPLTSTGSIVASTQSLVGGTNYPVIAHYAGDGTSGVSDSNAISVTVNPEATTGDACVMVVNPSTGATVAGSVSLAPYSCSSGTAAQYGDMIYIRADVFGVSGQETASGNVSLLDSDVAAGIPNSSGVPSTAYPLNSEGYTEDQTAFLTVGSHSFSVQYTGGSANTGDASYSAMTAASAAVSFTVTAAPTTTQLTASASTIATGAPVTVTAFVDTLSATNPSGGSLGSAPTGTVTFTSSTGTALGTVNVITPTTDPSGYVAGTASLTFTPSATLTVTAVYTPAAVGGAANYVTSSSQGVVINVGTAGVNTSPGCSSSTITISSPGGSGTCVMTVTGVNGFAGTVALSAAVSATPPSAVDVPNCTFGAPDQNFTPPSTITLSASSETGSATMTCSTTAASRILVRPPNPPSIHAWPLAGVALSLASLFLFFFVPRQRRWGLVPLLALLVVIAAAGISCSSPGAGGVGGVTNPGTTAGAYTFKVTATPSSGSAQITTITVSVQ